MMTDPIADMLTRIRNANMIKKDFVDVPCSRIKLSIAEILLDEGYIDSFQKIEDGRPVIRINLKYSAKGEKIINEVRRISTPSRRFYIKSDEIKPVCGGLGFSIVSTSQGLLSGKNAKFRNLGGELLCEIW
jgi:small subunit ribosomal protein S8